MPPAVSPSTPPSRRARAAVFLPPLAAFAALAVFAAHQRDPLAAAETAFLAVLATALLAALAAVEAAPGTGRWAGRGGVGAAAALLVVLAGWTIPAGPARAAAVAGVAVAALAVAAGRRLTGGAETFGKAPAAGGGSPRRAGGPSGGRSDLSTLAGGFAAAAVLVPLAVGSQVLVRSQRLLAAELDLRLLVGLLGLPAAAALAVAFLVVRGGRAPALTAAATVALAGPGFTLLTTGALVALAGAEAAWRPAGRGRGGEEGGAAGAEGRGGGAAGGGEEGGTSGGKLAGRAAGLAVAAAGLVAVGFVEPRAAAVVGLAGLAIGGRRWISGLVVVASCGWLALPWLRGGLAVGGEHLEIAARLAGGAASLAGSERLLAVVLLAPLAAVLALAAADRDGRRWGAAALAAFLLALVAARHDPGLPLAAAPLAAVPLLAGVALRRRAPDERHALFAPQLVWSAGLLAATALAAAYPWLRPRPLAAALGLFAAGGAWAPAAVALLAAGAVGAAMVVAKRRGGRPAQRLAVGLGTPVAAAARAPVAGRPGARPPASLGAAAAVEGRPEEEPARDAPAAGHRPGKPPLSPPRVAAGAATVLLAAALLAGVFPPSSTVLLDAPAELSAASPRLEIVLPPGVLAAPAALVADTSLSHAAAVAQRSPVALVRLLGAAPPVAGGAAVALLAGRDTAEWAIRRPDVAATASHRAPEPWLARATAEGFFGLVFRARLPLPATAEPLRLVVERHPSLPPETIVHLHRLELAR
jgi:hypothetical protein